MATTTTQTPAPTPLGYPRLAEYLGEHPNFALFRRFGALSSRNLLYYQAELLELKEELEDLERRDNDLAKSDPDNEGDRASTWYWLGGKGCDDHSNKDQLNLVLKLRRLLQEYSTFIASKFSSCVGLFHFQMKL
jgi:hypothetical protein